MQWIKMWSGLTQYLFIYWNIVVSTQLYYAIIQIAKEGDRYSETFKTVLLSSVKLISGRCVVYVYYTVCVNNFIDMYVKKKKKKKQQH